MKPGDKVLVRATYDTDAVAYSDDKGPAAWVRAVDMRPYRVSCSSLTTEAAIRASALEEVAEELEAHNARHDTNYGVTYCTECGAPQAVPWEHDGCAVALVRARAAALRGAT